MLLLLSVLYHAIPCRLGLLVSQRDEDLDLQMAWVEDCLGNDHGSCNSSDEDHACNERDYGNVERDPLETVRWNVHMEKAGILLAHGTDLPWDKARDVVAEEASQANRNILLLPALALSKGELMDVRRKRLELEAAAKYLQQQHLQQQQLEREELERQHQLESGLSGDPMGSQHVRY